MIGVRIGKGSTTSCLYINVTVSNPFPTQMVQMMGLAVWFVEALGGLIRIPLVSLIVSTMHTPTFMIFVWGFVYVGT